MPTQRKKTKQTENRGVIYVSDVVNKANCILNKIDGSDDIGLDGYLEFTKGEFATGLCIGVQIKSGDSYQTSDEQYILLKSDQPHFEYWSTHTLPICGIVYIPGDEKAYWIDITEYLSSKPILIEKGPFDIRIKKINEFTPSQFAKFQENFSKYKSAYNEDWNFGRALKSIANSSSSNDRVAGIKALFYYHRNEPEAWYYLIHHFKTENDPNIQLLLITIFQHFAIHGDIWWHSENIFDEDVSKAALTLAQKTFTFVEVRKMISHIDENGLSRGSIGQVVYAIVDRLPYKIDFLKKVIIDSFTSDTERFWSAIMAAHILQFDDLERAINLLQSMIEEFPNSEFVDEYVSTKQSLVSYGHFGD